MIEKKRNLFAEMDPEGALGRVFTYPVSVGNTAEGVPHPLKPLKALLGGDAAEKIRQKGGSIEIDRLAHQRGKKIHIKRSDRIGVQRISLNKELCQRTVFSGKNDAVSPSRLDESAQWRECAQWIGTERDAAKTVDHDCCLTDTAREMHFPVPVLRGIDQGIPHGKVRSFLPRVFLTDRNVNNPLGKRVVVARSEEKQQYEHDAFEAHTS